MSSAAATAVKNQAADASQSDAPQVLTDGFQLVIDAFKLNDIETARRLAPDPGEGRDWDREAESEALLGEAGQHLKVLRGLKPYWR